VVVVVTTFPCASTMASTKVNAALARGRSRRTAARSKSGRQKGSGVVSGPKRGDVARNTRQTALAQSRARLAAWDNGRLSACQVRQRWCKAAATVKKRWHGRRQQTGQSVHRHQTAETVRRHHPEQPAAHRQETAQSAGCPVQHGRDLRVGRDTQLTRRLDEVIDRSLPAPRICSAACPVIQSKVLLATRRLSARGRHDFLLVFPLRHEAQGQG
jgi:hypothetical protein